MIKYIYSNFYNFFLKENIPLLGRWCHKNLPNCCDNVIEKKMSMAIMDNDMGLTKLKFDKDKKLTLNNKKLSIHEYINNYYSIK